MKRILLILAICLAAAPLLGAQDTSAQQSRKSRLEQEIAAIELQLKENKASSDNALGKLSLVRRKVSARKELLAETEREIKSIDDSIRLRKAEAAALQARLDTLSLYYSRLVASAYRNRDSRIWFMYIMASGNMGQALRRYGYLRSLSARMNGQAEKIKATKAELDARLVELSLLRSRAETLRAGHRKYLADLETERGENEALVARLGKEKNRYQKELKTKKRQVEDLNREIQKIIADYVKAQQKAEKEGKTEKAGTSGTAEKKAVKEIDYRVSGEFAANKGKIPWPCSGTVLERFGRHNHPVYTTIEMPFNNGINIGVAKGTRVRCVFEGEVRKIIVMPGYNKCVLVQHGTYFTFYCKLGAVAVKAGDKLKAGDEVGTVDTIDGQTQLHFQLWEGSTPCNPEDWLKK